MIIEEALRTRLLGLVKESHSLRILGNEGDQCTDPDDFAACSAWITAAQNAVHILIAQPSSPYRSKADRIAERDHGFMIHHTVAEFATVIANLLHDADAGLLATVADQARAETFDDFLDHADEYAKRQLKNEAGAIAGVVFEDSLRRICRKLGFGEKDVNLDQLISDLAARGVLTGLKAKRARAAAHLRTKATHAQWNEFELADVRATIELTRELIDAQLA